MPKLTTEEVEDFLSEPGHLARIGTVDDDGMPRVVPLWFIINDSQLLFREPLHSSGRTFNVTLVLGSPLTKKRTRGES
ncbi:MAG: pyridoxamine 5'-phosphate oxidase family protein [Ilumatobacteraceae bacterium]